MITFDATTQVHPRLTRAADVRGAEPETFIYPKFPVVPVFVTASYYLSEDGTWRLSGGPQIFGARVLKSGAVSDARPIEVVTARAEVPQWATDWAEANTPPPSPGLVL